MTVFKLNCIKCGCQLIINYSWRISDKEQGKYICIDCDNERRREYHKLHIKEDSLKSLKWHHKNKEKSLNQTKKYSLTLDGRYKKFINQAKKRNLNVTLTKKQFEILIKKNCYYCNEKINKYNGIDRVDNTIGYHVMNCVTCCTICNRMKSNLSLEDFLNKIKSIGMVMQH